MPTALKVYAKERYVPFPAPLARKKLVDGRWEAGELLNQVVPLSSPSVCVLRTDVRRCLLIFFCNCRAAVGRYWTASGFFWKDHVGYHVPATGVWRGYLLGICIVDANRSDMQGA